MLRGWPRTLTWADFTALPNPGPGQLVALNGRAIVARVSISIMFYPGTSQILPDPGILDQVRFGDADVSVILNRGQMQYVPSRIPRRQEAYYLRHEQGHLDLMGLFARELYVNLMRLRSVDSAGLLRAADRAVDEAVRQARMYAINPPHSDCVYDRDTNHGQLRRKQDQWNHRIAQNIAHWHEPNFRVLT